MVSPTTSPYVGFHGEGCEYAAEEFACDGHEIQKINYCWSSPCVPVSDDGVSPADLSQAKAYFRVKKAARKLIYGEGSIPILGFLPAETKPCFLGPT